ncbi:MAG: folate family ECF transporter S component [Lachnospiraceae bacterium]|nr:folate family ECF transporter S component [Lachnospiraceae bacterium]
MLKKIKNSALEFKSVRSLVIIAMLLAVHTVLSIVGSVRVSDSLKISTGFVATAIMAVSYGPVVGLIFGAAGDIIQWMINPTGPLALGLTLNAALAAMVYGFTLYKKLPKKAIDILYMLRIIVCVSLINILINAVLGTYWLADLYGWDYKVYFWPRLIKNLIQIPINSIIIYFVMQAFSNNRYLRQMIGA